MTALGKVGLLGICQLSLSVQSLLLATAAAIPHLHLAFSSYLSYLP